MVNSAPPSIILVRPQLGENIGATARAMMNFGLSDLRLVAPRDGWPNARALAMAAHAVPVLEAARVYGNFAEATADLQRLYGTSARGRDLAKPVLDARGAAAIAKENMLAGMKTGLVFGPERTGLANAEAVLCDALVTIPTDPKNASLNLAQSAVVLFYEWFQAAGATGGRAGTQTTSEAASPVNPEAASPPATRQELEGFFAHLEELLEKGRFFKTEAARPKLWQGLRNLFVRAGLSGQEVRTLRGVLRAVSESGPPR